jgi:peptide/nickel transport system substrate-binding protein
MAEIDRKTAFFEALLQHTPVDRRAFVQRAAALGLVGPAAFRLGGSALAQSATPTVSTQKGGDGTLIVTVGGDPLSFNPNFQVDDNAFVPACNIYNMLVTLDSSYAVLPELAKSWETAADGLTITFHLVDNAKWHDGQPVTSADVKYTFDTIMANTSATASSFFSSVASIDAPDQATVVLNMKKPSASLISFLGWYGTHILPAHIYQGTDWTTNPANQSPVGSGPFTFSKYESGASIELAANTDYWGEGPFVDRLVFSIVPDANTAEQSLLNGETDVLTVSPPRSEIATLDQTDGIAVVKLPIPSFYYVQMNLKRQYTSNLEVRKAISMAINRQQIVDVALGGYSDVATTFYPKEIPWAANTDPDAMVPQYDPDAAKAALDAAGFPLNGDFRFKLVFIHFTIGSEYADMAAIIKQNLKDVGIDCEIVALEIGAFGDRALAGDFDLNVISGLWGPDPENLKIRVGTGGAVNTSFYSNPEVDTLLDEGSSITDQKARAEKYWQVQAILAKDLPISPLATQVLFYPHSTRVSGLPYDEGIGRIGLNRFTITHVKK